MSKHAHAPAPTSSIVITVSNGEPSQTKTTLPLDKRIIFVNLDSVEYLIELWNHDNDESVHVCPVLPPNGSVTFVADLDDVEPGDECHYNIEAVSPRKVGVVVDGGGHVIIIGN